MKRKLLHRIFKWQACPLQPRTFALALLLLPSIASAQVATDGSLGSAVRLNGPTFQIAPGLGVFRGSNLFHSFSQFSIGQGERAIFQGAGNTRFIIARVTGGGISSINGQLTTAPLGASLFIINPAGIAFGPDASLNLGGSFHASTAGGLRLADGTLFPSDPRQNVELTSAAPDSFVFSGPSGRISLEGSFLRVAERNSVGLHAGSILLTQSGIKNAVITAPSGQISLTAFQSTGEVRLDGSRVSGTANGALQILNGSLVAVSEGAQGLGGGRLVIRGGEVQVERSILESRTRRGNGGGLLVEGSQSVVLNNSSLVSSTTGAGNAGDISLSGRQISMDGALLDGRCDSGCTDSARGANIRITADESLDLQNGSRVLAVTRAAGSAGNITVQARDINIQSGSGMDTSCDPGCGTGAAGSLSVSASGSLTLAGNGSTPSFLVANSFGQGNAGRVELRAGTLTLSGNAQVESITVQSGASPGVSLEADVMRILNGAQVVTSTRGSGNGGILEAIARQSLTISGTRLSNNGTSTQIIAASLASDSSDRGNAGTININTPSLRVLAGGEISSSTLSGAIGSAGTINIIAAYEIIVDGTDATNEKRSAIISNTFSAGNAGRVNLTTQQLSLSNKGAIFSQTEGSGAGGTIDIKADSLTLASGAQIGTSTFAGSPGGTLRIALTNDLILRGDRASRSDTGLFSDSTNGGRGGSIDITARNVLMSDNAVISSSVDRAGVGGDMSILTRGRLELADGSQISSFSTGTGLAGNLSFSVGETFNLANSAIRTSARLADGGNIVLRIAGDVHMVGGIIETAVGSGLGSGGNLAFSSSSLLMRNSTISANAFGGNGGNIRIGSPLLIANAASSITASSTLGIDGTVQLDSPAIDLSALLSSPFLAYLDTTLVGSGSCLPRAAAAESRLALVASRKDSMRRFGPVSAALAPTALPMPHQNDGVPYCSPKAASSANRP